MARSLLKGSTPNPYALLEESTPNSYVQPKWGTQSNMFVLSKRATPPNFYFLLKGRVQPNSHVLVNGRGTKSNRYVWFEWKIRHDSYVQSKGGTVSLRIADSRFGLTQLMFS